MSKSYTRVLYVTQYFSFTPTHAAAVTTYEIVRRLAKNGHKVTMLVPNFEHSGSERSVVTEPSLLNNVNVVAATSLPLKERESLMWYGLTCSVLYAPLFLKALKNRSKYDVIVSMYHPSHLATFCAYMISRILKLPLLIKVHDLLPDTMDPNLFRRVYKKTMFNLYSAFLKKGDFVLVPSIEWVNLAEKVYNVSKEKMILFRNGVDTEKFNPNVECKQIREVLGLENKSVVLFAGRFSRIRGLEHLCKAVPSIVEREPNARFLIIGEGGSEKLRLYHLLKRLGVDRFVVFVDEVEHDMVPKYVCLADVTIGPLEALPITIGTLPIKVLEYLACGKPVIACHGGFSRGLVVNDHNGVLVRAGDVQELASAIIALLVNHELVKRLGRNARKHVERFYDWDIIIEVLENMLYTTHPK